MLTQVRAAVGRLEADAGPARPRHHRITATSRSRSTRTASTEAIAFLEWLRDDNFTFLGMREFRYSGGEKTRHAGRADQSAGLGILADPDVRVLAPDRGRRSTTPEIRAFLHGPDPLIVTKANAKSVVHRRAYLDYIGIKTFDQKGRSSTGELRRRRPVHLDRLHALGDEDPYLRSKAETVIQKSGFDPNDHSGKALINVLDRLPARRALPDADRRCCSQHAEAILGLVERPPRPGALSGRPVRPLRFGHRLRAARPLRFDRPRKDRRLAEDRLRRPALRLLPGLSGRRAGARPFHHRPLRRQDAEGRAGRRSRRRSATSSAPGRMRCARQAAAFRRRHIAACRRRPEFPESYRGSLHAPLKRCSIPAASRAYGRSNSIAIDYYRHADQPPERAALKIYHHGKPVALSRRVPVLENIGFQRDQRAHLRGRRRSGRPGLHPRHGA